MLGLDPGQRVRPALPRVPANRLNLLHGTPREASASSVADTVAWARGLLRRYGELFPEDPR
jgi:hypothetical protein